MKKNLFITFIAFGFFLLPNSSMGSETKLSIQIVCEIDPQVEATIESINGDESVPSREDEANNSKLKYDEAFKGSGNKGSLLKKDNWDILTESTKSHEFRKALDTKKITMELQDEMRELLKNKGFLIKDNSADYQVSFKVQKISYDDLKGTPHALVVYYKLIRGKDVIYQNSFVPQEKKYLFGGGKYTQLIKTKAVAAKITSDLYDKIK